MDIDIKVIAGQFTDDPQELQELMEILKIFFE